MLCCYGQRNNESAITLLRCFVLGCFDLGIGDCQQKLWRECISADQWPWYLTWNG